MNNDNQQPSERALLTEAFEYLKRAVDAFEYRTTSNLPAQIKCFIAENVKYVDRDGKTIGYGPAIATTPPASDTGSLSEEDRKRIGEYVFRVFNRRDSAAEMVGEYATKYERSAAQARIAELEAALKSIAWIQHFTDSQTIEAMRERANSALNKQP